MLHHSRCSARIASAALLLSLGLPCVLVAQTITPGRPSILDAPDITTPARPKTGRTKMYPKNGGWCSLSPAGAEYCSNAVPASLFTDDGSKVSLSGRSLAVQDMTASGTLAVAIPLPEGGTSSQTANSKLGETVSVRDYGVKGDGVTDDGPAINALFASRTYPRQCLYFPAGTYKTSITITNNNVSCISSPGKAVILYTGTGTAMSLSTPGGYWDGLRVTSAGNATIGIDVTGGTEWTWRNLTVGGSPTSGFPIGVRFRGATGKLLHFSSSWNAIGILFDFDLTSNQGVVIDDAEFYQSSIAAISMVDLSQSTIINSHFEMCQNAILADNTARPVNNTHNYIAHNIANLGGTGDGITQTNPFFINLHGGNSANALNISYWTVEHNAIGGTLGLNCNSLTRLGGIFGGSVWTLFFRDNNWQGCSTSAIYGDTSAVYALSANDTFGSTGLFGGPMIWQSIVNNTDGNTYYNSATSGSIVLPNARPLMARNASGTANISMINVGADNHTYLPTYTTFLDYVNFNNSGNISPTGKATLANYTATAAAATAAVGQISYGGTVVPNTFCGTLAGSAGCVVINVAGTVRYVPYW